VLAQFKIWTYCLAKAKRQLQLRQGEFDLHSEKY